MSTNDDSASRRGRQGAPERRPPNGQNRDDRWDQSSSRDRDAGDPYLDQQGRDAQAQRYSGFSGHAYPPPRPNQAPPIPPQQPRAFDTPPPAVPQGYYPASPQRADHPRAYADPAVPPYAPPPQSYEPDHANAGYHDTGRDELFARDPALSYEQTPYGTQGAGYQAEPYDQNRQPGQYPREAASPLDDYERSFTARMAAQESQASRFFLPEDQAQQQRAGYAPVIPQAPMDQAYGTSQQYNPNGHSPNGADHYDPRYAGQEAWSGDENRLHVNDGRSGVPQRAAHGDELDEDFFADEDELDHDHYFAPKRGRKKLIAAALVGAIAVGGGGAYYYKTTKCCTADSAMPLIHADTRPLKEVPGNPGGKQFPNGEKAIYDRLTPNGQQTASLAPNSSAPQSFAPGPAAGNSLEDRIEEALKKAQRSGDAPAPAQGARPGLDQPTVVRSESYRPDGTRVDGGRPTIAPSIVNVNGGQLPPPFGNAVVPSVESQPSAAPFRAASMPSAPSQQFASMAPPPKSVPAAPEARTASFAPASEPARGSASGFYVSLKSAPDEKAIQRELPALTDKYKSVLGDVTLTSKIADLGAKGVKFRAVAGPLGTRQEAMELCQKIKGVGGDCFVAN